MSERDIAFKITPNNHWKPSLTTGYKWPLENILAPHSLYKKHRKALIKENLLYLEQLLKQNGKLVTWQEYKKYTRTTNKGKTPNWFLSIEIRTTDKTRNIINTEWQLYPIPTITSNTTTWSPQQPLFKTHRFR